MTAVNVAASDAPGVLRFSENGSMSTVNESGGVAVRAIRLDDFVADGNPPPGIIKIDVEGHGAQCLAGMQHIIERHRPVLFIEVHNVEEEGRNHTPWVRDRGAGCRASISLSHSHCSRQSETAARVRETTGAR